MTLDQFVKRSENEKLNIFLEGIRVGEYVKDGCIYVCKQVDDFYIEVVVEGTTYAGMKYHRDTTRLDPYLNDIDISKL